MSGWALGRRPADRVPIRHHYREIMVVSELLKPPPRRFHPVPLPVSVALFPSPCPARLSFSASLASFARGAIGRQFSFSTSARCLACTIEYTMYGPHWLGGGRRPVGHAWSFACARVCTRNSCRARALSPFHSLGPRHSSLSS